MKTAFRIIGWVMFAALSLKLSSEFAGIEMFDTVLFSLGGNSVGLQSYSELVDIAPLAAYIVYLLAFFINGFSVFKRKDYLVVNLTNFVLGVLLLIIYAPALNDYFPFGEVEWHVPALFRFLLWAYSSIIIVAVEFAMLQYNLR